MLVLFGLMKIKVIGNIMFSKFTGLMGVDVSGQLYSPSGVYICTVPLKLAIMIQCIQHWYAKKTWK